MIRSCAVSNKNEVIKGACELIIIDWDKSTTSPITKEDELKYLEEKLELLKVEIAENTKYMFAVMNKETEERIIIEDRSAQEVVDTHWQAIAKIQDRGRELSEEKKDIEYQILKLKGL